jgi:hypothetical protein
MLKPISLSIQKVQVQLKRLSFCRERAVGPLRGIDIFFKWSCAANNPLIGQPSSVRTLEICGISMQQVWPGSADLPETVQPPGWSKQTISHIPFVFRKISQKL